MGPFLKISALLSISTIVSGFFQCPPNGAYVPAGYKIDMVTDFKYVESGLQIFRKLEISCDGTLTQWRFIPKYRHVTGLHLVIFRERIYQPLVFDIVGETYIHDVTLPDEAPGNWIFYPINAPIPVQKGDLLGFYYDSVQMTFDRLTITNDVIVTDTDKEPVTYVLLKDATSNIKNLPIDVKQASRQYRNPALTAIITPTILIEPTVPLKPSRPTTVATPAPVKPVTLPPPAPTTPAPHQPSTESTTISTTTIEPGHDETETSTTEALLGELPFVQPEAMPSTSGTTAERPPIYLIPSRCLFKPPDDNTCLFPQTRIYFDFGSGKCLQDVGCPFTNPADMHNFVTLDDCELVCLSSLANYKQLFVTLGTPEMVPAIVKKFADNKPMIENSPNKQLDAIFAMANLRQQPAVAAELPVMFPFKAGEPLLSTETKPGSNQQFNGFFANNPISRFFPSMFRGFF